jgi:tRNA(adenine34) deaminase
VTTGYEASFEPAMRAALALAAGAGLVGLDVPVGAVILGPDGAIVARAHNQREEQRDPTAHAEIVALRAAAAAAGGWRLDGHTLVVTLEPCTMCAGAIAAARIARLVYGAADPKAGAAGSLWDVLRDRRLPHRTEVLGGVLASECGALLRDFFAQRRPGAGGR